LNGLAEIFNSTWKKAMKKMYEEEKDLIPGRVSDFLQKFSTLNHQDTLFCVNVKQHIAF
jgi:hypothetical protein